jgi:hypothetical protein
MSLFKFLGVLGSNLGLSVGYLVRFFMVFLCPSRQVKEQYIDQTTPVSFQIPSDSSIIFEVLAAVVMSVISWDTAPCNPLKVSRRFGGIYRLHLQGRRIS